MIIRWLVVSVLVWLIVSLIMFVFSMGTMSPLENAPHKKAYWKWSTLLTLYIVVPFVGWLAGLIHLAYILGKQKEEKQKEQENKPPQDPQ